MITNPSHFFSLLSTLSSGTVVNTFTAEEDITPAFGELRRTPGSCLFYILTALSPHFAACPA
jgi:hypothetical protein